MPFTLGTGLAFVWWGMEEGGLCPFDLGCQVCHCLRQCCNGTLDAREFSLKLIVRWDGGMVLGRDAQDELECLAGIKLQECGSKWL